MYNKSMSSLFIAAVYAVGLREGSPKSSLLTEAGNMGLVRPRSADKSARRGLWGDLDNISSQPALLRCSGECDAAMVGSVVKYAF